MRPTIENLGFQRHLYPSPPLESFSGVPLNGLREQDFKLPMFDNVLRCQLYHGIYILHQVAQVRCDENLY